MRLTRSHKTEQARELVWAFATVMVVLSAGSLPAQQGSGQLQFAPQPGVQQATRPGLQYGGGIQLTQRITAKDSKPKRPLPYEIADMPDIQEEMEVIHRRSQLVITRAPISRIAIADPSIIDVVQYSPTEMGILGLSLGSTVLHLWFDGSPDPLIYLVEIVPDPT
jgi:pilus assembly protein CpaC